MPATIHDVARVSGVSVSTVSRAFSLPGMVRPRTLEAVLKAAAELDYRPNKAARAISTGKTGNLGVIVPDLGNPFFPSVLKGVQARAREADYAVFLADSEEDPHLEVELIHAMAKQVDGVILCSARMRTADLVAVSTVTSIVLLNRRDADLPTVLMAGQDGARQAVEHLAALGHVRIAWLGGPRGSWSNSERRRGIMTAARSSGMEVVEFGPFLPHFASGQQGADLAVAAGVTAVIGFNDLVALGVINRLNERGIATPGEISVVGFDDIAMATMCTPSLTSVSMPTEASGRAAVDLLMRQLGAGEQPEAARPRRLPAHLIVRGSTGAVNSTRRASVGPPLLVPSQEGSGA